MQQGILHEMMADLGNLILIISRGALAFLPVMTSRGDRIPDLLFGVMLRVVITSITAPSYMACQERVPFNLFYEV